MSDIYAGAHAETAVTGEAVTVDLAPASVGVRALSGLIDFAVQVVLVVAGLTVLLGSVGDVAVMGIVSIAILVTSLLIVPVALETGTRGKSLGKLATGLRVVRSDGGPVSVHHSLVRHLVGVVEVWLLSGVPALVSALVSPRGGRVGDLVAGTYVVRDRFALPPTPLPGMPPQLLGWAQRADLDTVPDALGLAVRRLLTRHDSLTPAARDALATDLAAQVSAHVSPPPPARVGALDFLCAVAVERRVREERRWQREEQLRSRLGRRDQEA